MNKHELTVLGTTVLPYLLELILCLNGIFVRHIACEALAYGMHATQEEGGLIVTGNGETRQGIHHARTKPFAVGVLQLLGSRRCRIIIIIGRNISVVFVELIQIILIMSRTSRMLMIPSPVLSHQRNRMW